MPAASVPASSRRWISVFSAKAASAWATRLCCSSSAAWSAASSSSVPSVSRVPFLQTSPPSIRRWSPSETSLEELRAGRVDQPHARADELERAGVRKASGRRGRDVDDDADAARSELLGRDAVDVGVIDDRDVVCAEVLDELLRPPPEPCAACHLTVHVSRRPRSPLRRKPRRRASARARRGALRRRARRSACVSGRPGPSRPAGAGRRRSRSAAGA